ncbi:MAG: hypothetical protein SGPRY_004258, partial [Prymnesium sp.]
AVDVNVRRRAAQLEHLTLLIADVRRILEAYSRLLEGAILIAVGRLFVALPVRSDLLLKLAGVGHARVA